MLTARQSSRKLGLKESYMVQIASTCEPVATEFCGVCSSSCDSVATQVDQNCPYQRRSLLEELAAKGVRLTAQRRVLVEIMQSARQHLDAAAWLEQARLVDPGIDRATVYRTIELLKRHGLVDELDLMHLKGEKHYYEAKTRRDHVHLACFECGRIDEYSSALFERLKREIAGHTGFTVKVARLELGGRCRYCGAAAQQ